MELLLILRDYFFSKRDDGLKSKQNFVRYRIIGKKKSYEYEMQCINTKAIFKAQIGLIVNDRDILYSLDPIQSCYIGMEYTKYTQKFHEYPDEIRRSSERFINYSSTRYGNYNICYQQRDGLICFECNKSQRQYIMPPHEIAFSKSLIEQFDAAQSFYIGTIAERSIKTIKRSAVLTQPNSRANLKLIVG